MDISTYATVALVWNWLHMQTAIECVPIVFVIVFCACILYCRDGVGLVALANQFKICVDRLCDCALSFAQLCLLSLSVELGDFNQDSPLRRCQTPAKPVATKCALNLQNPAI